MALENPNQRNKNISEVQSELNFMYETHNRRDLGKVFELLHLDTLKDKQRGGTVNFPQASLHLAVGVFLARTLTDLSWVELQRGWDLTTGDGRPPVLDDKTFAEVKTHLRNFSVTLNSFSRLFMDNRDSLTAEWCRTGGFAKVVNLFLTGFPISFFLNFIQPTPPVPPTLWSWPILFYLPPSMQETSVQMFQFIRGHPLLTEAFVDERDVASFNSICRSIDYKHPLPESPPVPLSQILESTLHPYHPHLPERLIFCFKRLKEENLCKFLTAKPQFYIYQSTISYKNYSGHIILSLDKTTLERFNQEEIQDRLANLSLLPQTDGNELKKRKIGSRAVKNSNVWRRVTREIEKRTTFFSFPHPLPNIPLVDSIEVPYIQRSSSLFLWVYDPPAQPSSSSSHV